MPPSSHGPRESRLNDAKLFAQVLRSDELRKAWTRVWRNSGAAGGDRITVEVFQRNVMRRLAQLRSDLLSGDYAPGPLRHAEIPKSDGSKRPLAIPCIVDRVAQTAVAQVIGPQLDEEFEEASFGFRRGRSVQQAVQRVAHLRSTGLVHVIDADIKRFFEMVPHDALLERLGESMSPGPITELISLWLEHWYPTGRGLAQGSPISPLLANLYLDRLDEAFAEREAAIVRYADDFVILCRSPQGADAVLEKVRRLLAEFGLSLNEKKSRITDFDRGFRFLGHLFIRSIITQSQYGNSDDTLPGQLQALARQDREALASAEDEEAERRRRRDAGLVPAQRILYMTHPGRRLAIRNHAFAVEEKGQLPGNLENWHELLAVPHQDVDRIEIGPHAHATEQALDWALATDTTVAFVNGHGETLGWLAPGYAERAGRQLAQARHALSPELRLSLSWRFVDGRVRNQRALLRRLNGRQKDATIVKALARLNAIIRRVPHAGDIKQLMGFEGEATAIYWPALGRCLGGGFVLRERARRPARDAVNIMLNMTTSLLSRDATTALVRAGLHPGFGVLHSTGDRRDAAVFDFVEEFRAPLAESVVVAAINSRAVQEAMFTVRDDGGCRMGRTAQSALIRAYERAANRAVTSARTGRRTTWRGVLDEQAQLLAAHFEGREVYKPYVMDY